MPSPKEYTINSLNDDLHAIFIHVRQDICSTIIIYYDENGELKTISWTDSRIDYFRGLKSKLILFVRVIFSLRHAIQSSHRSSLGCIFRDLCQFDVDRFAFRCPKWRHTL